MARKIYTGRALFADELVVQNSNSNNSNHNAHDNEEGVRKDVISS